MKPVRTEWKVGLFVFAGIVLLAALLLNFSKGLQWLTPTYDIRLRTRSVGDLKPGAAVLMAGVPVGTVDRATLDPEGRSVTLHLRIQQRYPIRADARFFIEQSGFLGDQYVAIVPQLNQQPPLAPGAEVWCEEPFNLQEAARTATSFIVRLDETARKLNDAISRIDRFILNEHTLTNVSTAFSNFRLVSERALNAADSLNTLIATNEVPVQLAISNLQALSDQLNAITIDARALIHTNRDGVERVVKNVESSTAILNSLLNEIQNGEGLVSSLIQNETNAVDLNGFLRHMREASQNLAAATSNLNARGLWKFLWPPKPPKPLTNPPANPRSS